MRKMKILDNAYNKIPDSAIGIVSFAANILAILSIGGGGLFAIVKIILFLISGKPISNIPWHLLLIIALIMILLMFIVYMHGQKVKHMKERKIASQMYYRLLHDYRNTINQLECYYKRNNLTLESLTAITENFLVDALGYLSETLTYMTGYEVSSCVKSIVGGGFARIAYKDARVKTFVRSKNTKNDRKSYDEHVLDGVKISENTDFMDIVSENRIGNDSAFYQTNLKAYDKMLRKIGQEYHNTTPRWDEYYIGTVVVPIRIANKRLFYTQEEDSYNTLGFLCVDSLSDRAFTVNQKENYTHIVKSYAAVFYNVLSKYQFYLQQLTVGNNISSVNCTDFSMDSQQGNNSKQNTYNSKKKRGNNRRR